MYKATIDFQFGSQENFDALYKARMTPETKKQLDESIKQAVEQIKAQQGSDEAAKDEEQAASDEKGLDTKLHSMIQHGRKIQKKQAHFLILAELLEMRSLM